MRASLDRPRRRLGIGPRRGALRRWALRYPTEAQLELRDGGDGLSRSPAHVTVAIPHWRATEWCTETAASFARQEGLSCSIAVVDNSGDLDHLGPDVEIIRTGSNLGYAGAVNLILKRWLADEAAGDFFVAACHDCVLPDDGLRRLVDAMRTEHAIGIAGFGPSTPGRDVEATPWVSGTCLSISRACARQVGEFDERLGTYDEDVDYCLRAWDAGWGVITVGGTPPVTRGSVAADRIERIARNHVLLAAKRRGMIGAVVEFCLQVRHGLLGLAMLETRRPDGAARQRLRGATRGLKDAVRGWLRHL